MYVVGEKTKHQGNNINICIELCHEYQRLHMENISKVVHNFSNIHVRASKLPIQKSVAIITTLVMTKQNMGVRITLRFTKKPGQGDAYRC